MGFRFARRIRIIPGVRLNVSRSGVSASFGGRGAWYTVGPRGKRRVTVGLPGTGISYTQTQPTNQGEQSSQPEAPSSNMGCLIVLLIGTILMVVIVKAGG